MQVDEFFPSRLEGELSVMGSNLSFQDSVLDEDAPAIPKSYGIDLHDLSDVPLELPSEKGEILVNHRFSFSYLGCPPNSTLT